jgi:hypothetical protein
MQRVGQFILVPIVSVALSTPPAARANASEAQKYALLITAMESALTTTSLMRDRSSDGFETVSWSIGYSERNWTLRLNGMMAGNEVRATISGYLWGEDNADWLGAYAGLGIGSKEPISINGKAEWLYDSMIKDHAAMNIQSSVKFGQNSGWGWVVGSELIIGAALGGSTAFMATAVSGPGAVFVGILGAMSGAGSAAALSDRVKLLLESDTPVPPPALPNRPQVPQKDEKLEPRNDRIIVALSKEGKIIGAGPETLALSGSFSGNTGTGTIFAR